MYYLLYNEDYVLNESPDCMQRNFKKFNTENDVLEFISYLSVNNNFNIKNYQLIKGEELKLNIIYKIEEEKGE